MEHDGGVGVPGDGMVQVKRTWTRQQPDMSPGSGESMEDQSKERGQVQVWINVRAMEVECARGQGQGCIELQFCFLCHASEHFNSQKQSDLTVTHLQCCFAAQSSILLGQNWLIASSQTLPI